MDLQNYQTQAKRTMNWKLDDNGQLTNFGLGIVGEFGEVDEILEAIKETQEEVNKIMDEVGDVFWYIANFCTFMGIDWRGLFPQKKKRLKLGVVSRTAFRHASKIADIIKKTTAQHHELNKSGVIANLTGMMDSLMSILAYYGLTPQEVCAYNHMKLIKRYPNGFESERSTNREV